MELARSLLSFILLSCVLSVLVRFAPESTLQSLGCDQGVEFGLSGGLWAAWAGLTTASGLVLGG